MNIVELAMGMGATNMTYTEQEATKIVELEIRLASLTTPGTTYEKKTIRELQKQYRSICWKTYITNMLDIEILKDKPLRYTDVAIVFQSDYLDRMFEILKSTPRSTLASYVEYRAIAEMLDIVGINIYRGAAQTAISACIPLVMQSLPVALSALYVKKYLTPELKQSLTPLVDNTKSGLVEEVDNSPWVDNETRTNVKEKISAMYELIGYPDELLDNAKVDDYYKSVQKSDNYLEFYLNISRFTDNDTFAKLREVPNRTDWSTHSSVIDSNAFYNPFENSIQILAGIITLPFYDPNRPNYVNYGTMGSIIAHEINHGVSGLGLDYDKDGLLATIATTEAVAKLNEARLCIKTQYAAMSGSEESAALTNNEDQADTVGVLAAYNAYQIWARQFGPDDSLPNYEKYTANQMFWISYGRLWCAKESSFYLSNIAPFADHSRYIFRVLGPLMNSDEFSRDFNCPSGSYMNPVKKCRIWK
ncbi:neprilysin-2-like isoform X2 [Photinus pyralis]|nr:neprilysin-2-like isoform X2 [Photinus pyralis]